MLTTRFEPASRKNVDRTRDPYIPRKGPLDVGVCPECHAISRKKRWYVDEAEYVSLARTGAVLRRCPACRKIADGFPSGVVTLHGKFLQTHRDEILAIVRNEERRARETNPLERIMDIRDGGRERRDSDHGRETCPAHRAGDPEGVPGDRVLQVVGGRLVRVNWSRDLRGTSFRDCREYLEIDVSRRSDGF